jgi:hypothetical protein
MAQVPVSMQVVVYPRDKSVKPYPATIVGYAWITGLAPDHGLPGDQPHPDHGLPGDQPHPDHGLPGAQPHPEHPIVLPPVDVPPPVDQSGLEITLTVKQAPEEGGWGLNLDEGWYYNPGPSEAGPKGKRR